jgi:hypothetical protein
VVVAFAVALLLCLGGGTTASLLTVHLQERGRSTPQEAVNGFLQAVYVDLDAEAADAFVCQEHRGDGSVDRRVQELRDARNSAPDATFTWTEPQVRSRHGHEVTVATTVSMVVDGQTRRTRKLRFDLVSPAGWFVCGSRQDG